jgi:tetratricopeptide (TPR) repeat protein
VSQEVDLADLERYLRIYQENPDSRVFAPLADMYRRLARFREAEQVSREGLLRHPYYAGGKVALAHILLDTERLQEALDIIEEVVTFYPDNLLARRILIKTLAGLNYWDRAEREFVAFRAMAPGMGDDPELLKILRSKQSSSGKPSGTSNKTTSESPRSNNASRPSSEKLLLLKKKHLLESWLKSLEAGRV